MISDVWVVWASALSRNLFGMKENYMPELTSQERAALITYLLCQGEKLTTKDVCGLTGLQRSGAYKLLVKLARVVPISSEDGVWLVLAKSKN